MNFEIKDIEEASFVIEIEIFLDRLQKLLGLSQKVYIVRIIERSNMYKYSAEIISIQKGDKFSLNQCLKNHIEYKEIE